MNDMLSPLERTLTAQIDRMLAQQRNQIAKLEGQVALLMEERERTRPMLGFLEQLRRAQGSSQP